MMLSKCALLLLVLVAAVHGDDYETFKSFMNKYNKVYESDAELNHRFAVFQANLAFISRHNSKADRTHDVGINQFADLTLAEFTSRLTASPSAPCFQAEESEEVEIAAAPTNLDWRSTGNVAPVANEGECGSVAYVNVANQISSAVSIAVDKPPVPLSAEQLIDCYSSNEDMGCNGGDPWQLYDYVVKHGLESEEDYPYSPQNATKCMYEKSKVIASITGTGNVTSEADMKNAVYQYGPTIALFDAGSQEFQMYTSGIFYTTDCSVQDIDHVLLLVGYGVNGNNTNYWIAQNVWGVDWGMNGYVNILRGKNTCGIATCSTYVTGAHAMK